MHVDIALDVALLNERGQFVGGGQLDLAAVLAHLRRNAVEAQLGVDLVFGLAGHPLVALERRQAVLVQRESHAQRALAQRDVVVLAAGEILHGSAEGFRRQQADIYLHAVAQLDADFVLALRQRLQDAGEGEDARDERLALLAVGGSLAGDQDVEVADGLAAAAQRAGGRDLFHSGRALEVLDEFLRDRVGGIEMIAAGDAAVILDALEDLLLRLLAHARQGAQLALAGQLFYAFQVADLKDVPDERDGLGPQALDFEQLKHRRAILFQQLGVQPQLAFFENFLQVLAHSLADAGNGEQCFLVTDDVGYGLSQALDGLCGAPVRADAERIVALDLHEVGGLVKDVGEGFVIEGSH